MGIRVIVNFVLLALPIGVTLGVLLGIQFHREATGQKPLFGPDDGNGSSGGGGDGQTNTGKNDVNYLYSCAKSYGLHPVSKGQNYTMNPNQWGWTEGNDGALCMNVTSYNNGTYDSKWSAPEFSLTWRYPADNADLPVHAYPNVMIDDVFPKQLSTISKIQTDFEWTYGVGNDAANSTDVTSLTAANTNLNVALDIFLDSNKTKAGNSSLASHEVMVWFATIGAAAQPLGLTVNKVQQVPANNMTIGNHKFGLYNATNEKGQLVLTWMSYEVVDSFSGDLYPLIDKIFSLNGANFPSSSDYVGYMAWGSEAYSSDKNVTFTVPKLAIEIGTS